MALRTILLTGLRVLAACLLFEVCFAASGVLSGLDKVGLISADWRHPAPAATEHGEAVHHILISVREARLTIKDGSRLDYEQLDRILTSLNNEIGRALTNSKTALRQPEQGGDAEVPGCSSELLGLQLKFSEIFEVTDDNLLIPITETMASLAPGSTFVGLTTYGKHREVKPLITGKLLEWKDGYTLYLRDSVPGHYILYFQTDRGHRHPGKNTILLRWGDIKDKIAYDLSENKRLEDLDMEDKAAARASH